MNSSAVDFSGLSSRYFAGVSFSVEDTTPGLFSLVSLLNFHLKKYAFSTLHANANDTPALDRQSLVSRLVETGAGYCFHHNVAFFEAMRAMNYQNMFFVAGTFPGSDLPTHIAIVWKKGDEDWYLVDPGAGYGISYAIPFHSSRNPGPYRIKKNGDAYFLEKHSHKTNQYESIYEFGIQSLSLNSDTFQNAVERLTTPKHIFYNNFWYFGVDPNNRAWNVILTVNDQGVVESEVLLIDGKKQKNLDPLTFTISKTNNIFRSMLKGDNFINQHLRQAIVERFHDLA